MKPQDFARLVLLTDPAPIPVSEGCAWDCYSRLWRPGKPHRAVWGTHWAAAGEAIPLGGQA